MMYGHVMRNMRNCRAYLTTQGYVGLGTMGMKVGDMILFSLARIFHMF
jgi:hypothetical protein